MTFASLFRAFKEYGDEPYWFWKSIFGIIIYIAVGSVCIGAFAWWLGPIPKPCFENVAVCRWENEQLVCRSHTRSCQ